MSERDTMCAYCSKWTHILTERGKGTVFCRERCRTLYLAERGLGQIKKACPLRVGDTIWAGDRVGKIDGPIVVKGSAWDGGTYLGGGPIFRVVEIS